MKIVKVILISLASIMLFASCSKEEITMKNSKETGDQSTGQNSQGSGG